jgi:hypothetical protein
VRVVQTELREQSRFLSFVKYNLKLRDELWVRL